jgi:hypothetical protein
VVIGFVEGGEGGAVRGVYGGLDGGVKFVVYFPLIMDSMYLVRAKERLRSSGLAAGSEGIRVCPVLPRLEWSSISMRLILPKTGTSLVVKPWNSSI